MEIEIDTSEFCEGNCEDFAYFIRFEDIYLQLEENLQEYIKQLFRKYNISEDNLLSVYVGAHYDFPPIITVDLSDDISFHPKYKTIVKKIENIIKYWFETSIYLYNAIYDKLKNIFDIPEYSNYYYLKYLSFINKAKNFGVLDGNANEDKILRLQSNDFKNRKKYNNLYVTLNLYINVEKIKKIKEVLETRALFKREDIKSFVSRIYNSNIDKFDKQFSLIFKNIVEKQNPIILDPNVKEYFIDFYTGMFDKSKGIFLILTICVYYTGNLNLDYLYLDKLKDLFLETTVETYRYFITEGV